MFAIMILVQKTKFGSVLKLFVIGGIQKVTMLPYKLEVLLVQIIIAIKTSKRIQQ